MNKRNENLLLFIISILFISLRIAFIDQKNLWLDEVFSWHLTLGSFREIIIRTSLDIHPPLYYFLLKVWNSVFGDSVFSMRFLSAMFSILSVFFVYSLARRLLNQSYSLVVLILFAINPLNVFFSQEARMFTLNLLLNAASIYFFLKMVEKDQGWKIYFKEHSTYLYIFFRTLALYTHYFSFFIFAVEILMVIIVFRKSEKNRIIPFLLLFMSVFLLYLPWLPILLTHLSTGQSWRYQQITHSPFVELLNFVKDLNLGLYYHYANLKFVGTLSIVLVLVFGIALILSIPKNVKCVSDSFPFLLVSLPITIAMIISSGQKIEFYRYLSILVPFVLIIVVHGISKIKSKYIVIPVFVVIMLINLYGLSLQYSFNFKNDDYRSLIKHIESKYEIGDRIYVEPHYMGWSIDYYKKQWNLSLPNPVYIRFGWNEILDSIKTQQPERFWVVFDYSAVDTSKYEVYIKGLKSFYRTEAMNSYYLAPSKVELYMFRSLEN